MQDPSYHRDPLSIHLYSKAPHNSASPSAVVGTSAPYAHVKKATADHVSQRKRKKKIYAPLDEEEGEEAVPVYIDKTLG